MRLSITIALVCAAGLACAQYSKEATYNYWVQGKQVSDELSGELREMWFAAWRTGTVGDQFLDVAERLRRLPKSGVDPTVIDDVNLKITYFETTGYMVKNGGLRSWVELILEAGQLLPAIAKVEAAVPRMAVPSTGMMANEEQSQVYQLVQGVRNREAWTVRDIRQRYGVELGVW